MKEIVFDSIHRQKHFEFFNHMTNPHFGVTANVDITIFKKFVEHSPHTFTPALVYLLARTANDIVQFRWRIRGNKIVEHNLVHPSFTVPTSDSDVFSFCYVDFEIDAVSFMKSARLRMHAMSETPSMEDEEGRDDLLFFSANPWVHFTSMQHPMHIPVIDSVPRVVWGKYQWHGDRLLMPLSVQAHHAIVDGKQLSYYFELLQHYLNSNDWVSQN